MWHVFGKWSNDFVAYLSDISCWRACYWINISLIFHTLFHNHCLWIYYFISRDIIWRSLLIIHILPSWLVNPLQSKFFFSLLTMTHISSFSHQSILTGSYIMQLSQNWILQVWRVLPVCSWGALSSLQNQLLAPSQQTICYSYVNSLLRALIINIYRISRFHIFCNLF